MTLATALREHILKHGEMSLGEFMARCNAHYYAACDPFGAQGDFITAPEISQIFGELIGAWLADCWQKLGSPHATLCELGGGRGTLLGDALRSTRRVPAFHEQLDVHLIETSRLLRRAQEKTLHSLHPSLHWQDTLLPLPERPLLLIANEFFDALPIEQTLLVGGQRVEQAVILNDNAFAWKYQGEVVAESSPASITIMEQIAQHIEHFGGAALIIDYGYSGGGAHADTLQAIKQHRFTHPLEHVGQSDLTAHVDFDALLASARGVARWGVVEQGQLLKRLGAELRSTALCKHANPAQRAAILSGLERLVSPAQMGQLFKCIAITSFAEAPAGF